MTKAQHQLLIEASQRSGNHVPTHWVQQRTLEALVAGGYIHKQPTLSQEHREAFSRQITELVSQSQTVLNSSLERWLEAYQLLNTADNLRRNIAESCWRLTQKGLAVAKGAKP